MTKAEWEKQKELAKNEPEEVDEIPTNIDELMLYNSVSWSDFIWWNNYFIGGFADEKETIQSIL